MKLEHKAALVTGGGRGIGGAIATRFGREGAAVAVADRDADTAAATAESIRQSGGRALAIQADVALPEDCARMVRETADAFGHIDILVNNAGVGFHRAFLDTTIEDWDRVLGVNLRGAFMAAQAAARAMVEQGGGRIINMGSINGQSGATGRSAYGVSKAGLMQLTRVMAVELGPLGIAVNAIAPGPIITDMTHHGPDQRRAYLDRIPMEHFGTPEAVAAAALFLASEDCQWLTGHVLNVDGGFHGAGLIYDLEETKHHPGHRLP